MEIEMDKESQDFFEKLLGIADPWYIREVEQNEQGIHFHIDFNRGAQFPYKGELYSVHDTVEKEWWHLNFFQYRTYLRANVPRINTPDGVKQVQVPWAQEGSGFTQHSQ